MPTYEYACDACDHRWEEFQSIKAEPTKKCPSCAKKKARRLISAGGGILFKGSGFYLTDYRSENYKKAASADKPASSGDSGGSSASGSSSSSGPKSEAPKPSSPKSDGGKS
ncbi:MAG: FmdB family transcriptional regulator [Planctomyces sp.]|nr:FmdB family transcriptional regulator [Planctomyces sp.]